MAKNTKTPAMVLQELSVKKGYAPPTYEIVYSVTGTHVNRFDYRVSIAGIEANGTGPSKQISKHNAAHTALMKLKDLGIYDPTENPSQEFPIPNQQNDPESPFKTVPNCIAPLKDLCLENKIPEPIFTLISDVGPPHSREFTYECSVASIKTIATGNTKKMAKQLAAKDMMERLNNVIPDIASQYNIKDNLPAIMDEDKNNKALQIYNEFYGTIVPDKTVKVDDYSHTLKKLMERNYLTFDDFSVEFSEKTEEALNNMLNKLGLSYKFYEIQDDPKIISLSLNTDTPFTTIGVSNTAEEAKAEALSKAFEIMEVFMKIKLS